MLLYAMYPFLNNNFLIGEAINQIREAKNLTQEQLGELMGIKRA